jgi:hypothetical protein
VAHGARQPAKAAAEMQRSLHWTEIANPWANPQKATRTPIIRAHRPG